MKGPTRKAIRWALSSRGYTISRRRPAPARQPPPLFDDPLEALHHYRGGRPAAFYCPLASTRQWLGFSYAPEGWHPFVATVQEYAAGAAASYGKSILRAYYDAFQPTTAAEAIPDSTTWAPEAWRHLPTEAPEAAPWTSTPFEEVRATTDYWQRRDYAAFGFEHNPAEHGVSAFGPVHPDLGEVEYGRLTELYASIREKGFDRGSGDVLVTMLKRGSEFRFLKSGGGMHRTAVMAALGHATIPATFRRDRAALFDVTDVDYWPNVRAGLWTREAATRYVDHLFDFDSARWAKERGLARLCPTVRDQTT